MDFKSIKVAVSTQFNRLQKYPLFRTSVTKDELWDTYLSSFPNGTNPIFRERTEHDCSCCRQFIRAVGNVVAIIDGEIVSLWDVSIPSEPAYESVTSALSALVKSYPISEPFLHYEPIAGVDRNFEQLIDHVKTWTHFYVNIDNKHIQPKAEIPSLLSVLRSNHDVLLRSLSEISDDAINTVLELIAQNSLYRGEEHKALVLQFRSLKQRFNQLTSDHARNVFSWTAGVSSGDALGTVSRLRNTVIGTLLTDLSEGKDLELAVRSFEAKVAPTNYKRPTALITPSMIERAKQELSSLGLVSALDRRYATIRDINVNDILFADRAARKAISGDVFDDLISYSSKPKNLDKVEEIPIDRFVLEIIPHINSLEILFENQHQPNLVSLIAPVDPTARNLFKWGNNFSWSYSGELADAIKERVKLAGGNVTGDLCCRLAWNNYDDLDFHMIEPGGYEIYYANRHSLSPSGGRLDVDMNITPKTREPVENIFYSNRSKMQEGIYQLCVNQFNLRENKDVGFECELDYLGQVYRFTYDKVLRTRETIKVAKFNYSHKLGMQILESLPSFQSVRSVWGISTQSFHRVSALMLSPNYWTDRGVGNRHYFFMIDGCLNDGTARGFFNEFLTEELTPHRKVFETVGSKMKPAESPDQLSGLGFSSTRHDTVICRVKGNFTRVVKIVF